MKNNNDDKQVLAKTIEFLTFSDFISLDALINGNNNKEKTPPISDTKQLIINDRISYMSDRISHMSDRI